MTISFRTSLMALVFITTLLNSGCIKLTTPDERRLLAEQGDPIQQLILGNEYYNGNFFVDKSYKDAAKWFQLAAKNTNTKYVRVLVSAKYKLASMYEKGEGFTQSYKEAYKLYKSVSTYKGLLNTQDYAIRAERDAERMASLLKNKEDGIIVGDALAGRSPPPNIAISKVIPATTEVTRKKQYETVSTKQPVDQGRWMTPTNNPDCKIWNPHPQPNETVTWSGQCVDGKQHGKGVNEWRENGQITQTSEGKFVNGLEVGLHTLSTDDYQYVGELKNGVYEGEGTYISTNGNGFKYAGGWKNGTQHGLGIMTNPTPDIAKFIGGYSNGKPHGKGVVHQKNGGTLHVEFNHGELVPSQAELDRASREEQNTVLLQRQAEAAERLADEAKSKRRWSAFEGVLKGLSIMSGAGSSSSTFNSFGSGTRSRAKCFLTRQSSSKVCKYDCNGETVIIRTQYGDLCDATIRR
jgi:hypothetical protein